MCTEVGKIKREMLGNEYLTEIGRGEDEKNDEEKNKGGEGSSR
jgi:hypothetical protein